MTWYLHCTLCSRKVFKTKIDPTPEVGAVLIAQHWKYMDDRQVVVGDRFFCQSCEAEFQPMIQKVSQTK